MVSIINGFIIDFTNGFNYGEVRSNGKTIFTGTIEECTEFASTH